jgi:hypothetical protein
VRLAVLLVPAALLLAACGGDALSVDPVAKAATATTKDGSAHIAFTASSTANGVTVAMTGSGDFSTTDQQGQMNVQFRSQQSSGTIRELMKDSTIYMISPLFRASLPAGKAWMKVDLKKAGRGSGFDLSSFSAATPNQTLTLLQKTGTVVRLGSETIDGVATTHYRATIDPDKLRQDKLLAKYDVSYRPVDVFIDDADHVRRLHLAYAAGGGGSSDMTMSFSRFGEPVGVELPDESAVWDATSVAAAALKTSGGKG